VRALLALVDGSDASSTGTLQALLDARLARWYEYLEHCRYSATAPPTVQENHHHVRNAGEDDQDWLNEEEFLHDFRVTRTFFFSLVGKISDPPCPSQQDPADGSAP
jgi:hypothetical protein